MIIEGKTYTPAPEGLHNAVCVDVVDLGLKDTEWGKKHKCRLVWEIEATRNDGKRFLIMKEYGVSLNEKATLRKDIQSWRGKPLTSDELRKFDLESLIGRGCQLVVTHSESDGKTYANAQNVMKPGTNVLTPSGSYTRKKDRKDEQQPAVATVGESDSY